MFGKKIGWFWKTGFIAISMMVVFGISGCSDVFIEETEIPETESEAPVPGGSDSKEAEEAEKVVEICLELYEKAAEKRSWDDLETVRGIVNRLGENGYTAIDSQNQMDMTCSARLESFCEKAKEKEAAECTVIEVTYGGGFSIYHFQTEEGEVYVDKSYYEYNDGRIDEMAAGSYAASNWNYTEDGYFMFSGSWFSEALYALTLSDAEEYMAFRVQPLDETCRELNRKYLLPIGYERNNMFLVDWSEKDFGELDFYDLYDILYPLANAAFAPYSADDTLRADTVYRIQKEDFEHVIMTYFPIDSETLQAKTMYSPEETAYEYRPRGFYEAEYPEWPYPEVVAFAKNGDGTISLTVNVVFPYAGISKVYAHEVVVRPLENGGVQYVSNHVIPSEENHDPTWHTPRLAPEEWEKRYGLPAEDREREEAEGDCRAVLGMIEEIYRLADKGESANAVLPTETILQMKAAIKETGSPVIGCEAYSVMENYEKMEEFLLNAKQGTPGTVILYEIHWDGGIGREKFNYDGADMSLLSTKAEWNANGEPVVTYVSHMKIKEWNYTEKGYFCCEFCAPESSDGAELADGSSLVRVRPLDGECRELSQLCVLPLGYQGNNILCSNWDMENLEELDYNGVYEYLYQMKHGERFDPERCPNGIPKEEFETLIMEYLPVTAEQLRKYAVFDEEQGTYGWTMLGCMSYAPTFFGTSLPEVVNVKKNGDGTVTLTVDAVCDMVICDDAVITHELTVRFSKDGGFLYLGNKILDDGIDAIPEYQYRLT